MNYQVVFLNAYRVRIDCANCYGLYEAQMLQETSQTKFDTLASHDAQQETPQVTVRGIPKDEIKLPETPEETVYYLIKEPKDE